MNLPETARVLTTMAAYDRRTIGDADVVGWQAVLSDAPFDDCMEAVKRHYAENTEWMMPAHVRRIVRDIHTEREMAATATGWAPGQHGVPKDQAMPEIAGPVDENALTAPVRALLESVRAMLPEGSREKLMPRREYWDREYRAFVRTRDAEPNPLYRAEQKYLGPCGAPTPRADCGKPYADTTCQNCDLCDHATCEGDVYGRVGAQTGTCRTCGATVDQGERRAWLDGEASQREYRAFVRTRDAEPNPLYRVKAGTACMSPKVHEGHVWRIDSDEFWCPGVDE